MPQRSDSHIIADLALNQVRMICNRLHWACEVVHYDYGDDLLVQPSYQGIVEHFKIWIQVKGTRNIAKHRNREGNFSINVEPDNVLKWVRSKDLAFVVLWDVEKNVGFWNIPKWSVNQWDYYLLESKLIKLTFSQDDHFNEQQAVRIGWLARIDHYKTLLYDAIVRDDDIQQIESAARSTKAGVYSHQSLVPLITFDFLRLVGVISSDDAELFDKGYLTMYRNGIDTLSKEADLENPEQIKRMAATLALLSKVEDIAPQC